MKIFNLLQKKKKINPMKKKWRNLMNESKYAFDISIDSSFSDQIFDYVIFPKYTENRYYHNLEHINIMLNHLRDFDIFLKEIIKLKLAIWFHDLIYFPGRKNNEGESAYNFRVFANIIQINEKDIDDIANLIIATKHDNSPETYSQKIICDLDLRELGTDNYDDNAKRIRKEYESFSNDEWNVGREYFLRSFLKKENIFHTKLYYDKFEEKARFNIENEWKQIK